MRNRPIGDLVDRITNAFVETFRNEQTLPADTDPAVLLEHFANYCVVSDEYDDEFDIHEVHTGGGDDLGMDGVAIVINGVLVTSADAAAELLATNGYIDARFLFVQAKSASSFSGSDMVAFGDGVEEFFAESLSLAANQRIVDLREVMTWVYNNSGSLKGRPTCELFYVTTGRWQDDAQLLTKVSRIESDLAASNLFETVKLHPWGASELQASWARSKNSVTAEFVFANKATLGDIVGVSESYLGVIPISEFLKIVSDPELGVRRNIFFDNVRDYQGDNPVNGEMTASLATQAGRDRFAVLNNGVTLVARELTTVADKFKATDYQIVNGCQTSHVLYNNRESLPEDMQIPFKVIASNDEEVISAIATATNRQTQVTKEDLIALDAFQKNLESYFAAFEDKQKLFYERRSKQYAAVPGIEKVRIITKQVEIKAFGAMFLNEAHRAARYYAALKVQIGSGIFNTTHRLDPYYTAAYAHYKLEFFFRNQQMPVTYKPARYHLLMAFRNMVGGPDMPALAANKIQGYSRKMDEVLWDDAKALEAFKKACVVIDDALSGDPLDGDAVKVQTFTDKVLVGSRA